MLKRKDKRALAVRLATGLAAALATGLIAGCGGGDAPGVRTTGDSPASASSAAADAGAGTADLRYIVLRDSAGTLRSGAEITPDTNVVVESGQTLSLLMPSGETKTIKGPYDDPVAFTGKVDAGFSQWAGVATDLLNKTGNESRVGGVRTDGPAADPRKLAFGTVGRFCTVDGPAPQIVRVGSATSKLLVTVRDASGKEGTVTFPARSAAPVNWPEGVSSEGKVELVGPRLVHPDPYSVELVRLAEWSPAALVAAGCGTQLRNLN